MSIREIGCCGAYCKICRESVTGDNCSGCKLGYDNLKPVPTVLIIPVVKSSTDYMGKADINTENTGSP